VLGAPGSPQPPTPGVASTGGGFQEPTPQPPGAGAAQAQPSVVQFSFDADRNQNKLYANRVIFLRRSLDHLVGEHKQVMRNRNAEGVSRFDIDNEIEFCRLLDRDIARFCPPQYFVNYLSDAPEHIRVVWPIRYKSSRFGEFALATGTLASSASAMSRVRLQSISAFSTR
jgi:hypothetical protein